MARIKAVLGERDWAYRRAVHREFREWEAEQLALAKQNYLDRRKARADAINERIRQRREEVAKAAEAASSANA